MGKKKKNGYKKNPIQKLLLTTAIIQLITAIINLIDKLLG